VNVQLKSDASSNLISDGTHSKYNGFVLLFGTRIIFNNFKFLNIGEKFGKNAKK
jgi:hypothetical protein